MSSTNRGSKRSPADFYATPPWVTNRLLEAADLPGGRWLEPCAGDGELIRTVRARRPDIVWSAGELREEMRSMLEPISPGGLYLGDLLELPEDYFGPEKFDVAITNPPFSIALPIIQKCMKLAKKTVMLLRLNFWGSDERAEFMRVCPPDTFVLPNRPMFSLNKYGKPGTDSPEYAWMVWESPEYYELNQPKAGHIQVLGRTPVAERKLWTEHLKRLPRAPECEASDSSAA